jgi:hypothetical protein
LYGVAPISRISPAVIIIGLLALACTDGKASTNAPNQIIPGPPAPSEALGAVHRFTDNWGANSGGYGCTPRGETLTLRGTIIVRPFGKGADGVVLRADTDREWILSYGAEGVLLEFAGDRVEITGRACDKGGQAMFGDHFDLATLTPTSQRTAPQSISDGT